MNELQDRFARALASEPPFETDLGASLDAAVRGGRRRRARAVAGKAVAVAACAVVVAGVALAIRPADIPAAGPVARPAPGSSPDASQPPAACTGTCPPQSIHHGVPAVPADVPDATLDALAKAVMTEGAGPTSVVSPREPSPAGVVTVKTGAGTYGIAVVVWAERFDAAAWASECLPGDGKPCRVQDRTGTDVTMASRYLDGSGRAKLQYVADAVVSGTPVTVEVRVDNLVEQIGSNKSVGPTWRQLGYTSAGIRDALAGTGLLT